MGGFRAAAEQIHLLFADEDEHYTDSLVRLDREQYIDYCLRKAGYQGIYFIEKQLTGKGGYRVIMGNPASADAYCYQASVRRLVFYEKVSSAGDGGKACFLQAQQSGGSDGKDFFHAEKSGRLIHGLCHGAGGFCGALSGPDGGRGTQKPAGNREKQYLSAGKLHEGRRELSGIYREKRGLWRDLFPKI